jgi:predicted ATP-grasp superfamily ATP-dependent carboligase
MNGSLELWEKPEPQETYLIAGWEQWADAGEVSSGLPQYLIDHLAARQIGQIKPQGFYMFQVPGTHHFLRPEVRLEAGYRKELTRRTNEFYYAESAGKGVVIFRGEEPHLNVEGYADALFDAAEALKVKRVLALGGVYGAVPYDQDRQVGCSYSLPHLKQELETYALSFSDYAGGVSIGTYLADEAERRGIEYVAWYAFVPAYDYSPLPDQFQGVRIENDARAWYELMRRVNYMFGLSIDLSDLRERSQELVGAMQEKITELEREFTQYDVKQYMAKVSSDFTETPFLALDDMWERELGDIFGGGA